MGIDNILEKISISSDKAAASELAKARERAAAIYTEKTEAAKASAELLVEAAEKEAIEKINHIKNTAALESRKLYLAAKREVIEEVFGEIPDFFKKIPKERYASFLAGIITKVSEKGTIYFANQDYEIAENVRDLLQNKPQYKISKTTVKHIESGFIIKYDNVTINCSIPSIIENMRGKLEPLAASKLFVEKAETK